MAFFIENHSLFLIRNAKINQPWNSTFFFLLHLPFFLILANDWISHSPVYRRSTCSTYIYCVPASKQNSLPRVRKPFLNGKNVCQCFHLLTICIHWWLRIVHIKISLCYFALTQIHRKTLRIDGEDTDNGFLILLYSNVSFRLFWSKDSSLTVFLFVCMHTSRRIRFCFWIVICVDHTPYWLVAVDVVNAVVFVICSLCACICMRERRWNKKKEKRNGYIFYATTTTFHITVSKIDSTIAHRYEFLSHF